MLLGVSPQIIRNSYRHPIGILTFSVIIGCVTLYFAQINCVVWIFYEVSQPITIIRNPYRHPVLTFIITIGRVVHPSQVD